MAGERNLDLSLRIAADDQASPNIAKLVAEIDRLTAELELQKTTVKEGSKDWLDYAQQTTATAQSMAGMVSTVEEVLIKTAEIGAAVVVYQKWRALVEGVKDAYFGLQIVLEQAKASGSVLLEAGWAQAELQAARLETTITRLGAQFLEFSRIGSALGVAGVALTLAEIGVSAQASNEKARALTEQIGGLTTSLQALSPASGSVLEAKARFEELHKAALALGADEATLVDVFKTFFDTTASGNLTVQQAGRTLTDFEQVQKSLHATSAETQQAQTQLNAAFESGLTTVPKLGDIFGSTLNPALDAVAGQMGITRAQLTQLINTGQVGSETVIPALAAAARNLTTPLQGAGDAADFSKKQFDAMGLSFYDLSQKNLPGVANALQYTAKEIATTADAAVDPIGAAVEQIVNFGARIQEWARLTQQSIKDAFAGPDVLAALNTGLKEAMYGLDYVLVGLREEVVATGQSIGTLAGAAVTASNPIESLSAIWEGMKDRLLNTRDRLNEYVNALEGVDNASARTTAGAQALADALKTLPEIKLPEALQAVIDKLDSTQAASTAVSAVWKELAGLDFTGTSIRNLLVLRDTIEEVSQRTGDATGTQAAFSKELANLPTEKLNTLVEKVTELKPRLDAAGDGGHLMQTVLGAVFDKLGLDAATAGGTVTRMGTDAVTVFHLIATAAETTGVQVRAALNAGLNSAKTIADVNAISAEFAKLGSAGAFTAQTIAEGQAAIARRFAELQAQLPGLQTALKALGVESAASLQALATSAEFTFRQFQNAGATTREIQSGFLAWAEAAIKAANANDAVVPAVVRNQAAALGLSTALQQLIDKHSQLSEVQKAQIAQTELNQKSVTDFIEVKKQQFAATENEIQQEIELAKASNDTFTARRLQVDLIELEAKHTLELSQYKQAEISAEIESQKAKLASLQAIKDQDDETQRQIGILTLKINALNAEAEAQSLHSIAVQANNEKEIAQAERMAGPLGALIRLYQQKTDATQFETTAVEHNYNAQIRDLEAQQRAAIAKGDSVKAAELSIQIKQAEAEKAQAMADALAKEANFAIALAEAKKVEILASEKSVEQKDKEIAALDALIIKQKEAVSAAQSDAENQKAAADVAQKTADGMNKTADATDKATKSTEQLNAAYAKFEGQSAIAFGTGVVDKFNVIIGEIKTSIDAANTAAQKLANEGLGAISGGGQQATYDIETLAARLKDSESYLNDAAHAASENLTNALRQARQEAEGLSESLAQMATDYEKEMLRIKGDEKALLELDYQEQLKKLDDLHQRAGEMSNDEYELAKTRAEQLHQMKLQQLAAENAQSATTAKTHEMNLYASATERAANASKKLASVDLSGLHSQLNNVVNAATGLARVL
jgi:tape measure domain-containing protein